MSDAHDIHQQVRAYLIVFGALLLGTFLTTAMYYVHFSSVAVAIAVALFIAVTKGSLVAGYFMHLISEKKLIYSLLMFTAFFFLAMMFLTVWSYHDFPVVHQ